MATEFKNINTDVEDEVYYIEIDREETYNALSPEVFAELEEAVERGAESDARVIVLEGAGDNFSAGGDYKWEKDKIENDRVDFHRRKTLSRERFHSFLDCPTPIITVVRGYAAGTGATVATLGDIVIASNDSKIGDLHVQNGTNAPDTPAFWPLLIGVNKTKELLMTGKFVSGKEAEEIGLVNRAVPEDELDEEVAQVIEELRSGPQTAIMYNKLAVNKWFKLASLLIRRESYALEGIAAQLDDHKEAVTAFNEKRDPDFSGTNDKQ